jgi:hypothetical protein
MEKDGFLSIHLRVLRVSAVVSGLEPFDALGQLISAAAYVGHLHVSWLLAGEG